MESTAFEQVIDVLQSERVRLTARLDAVRAEATSLESRLKDLDGVVGGLKRLELVEGGGTEQGELSASMLVPPKDSETDSSDAPPTRQRIRSTEMVADMVNGLGRPLTRDEVIDEFARHFGIPPAWSNPRNAIGNALSRAGSRGLILALSGDRWAPANYGGDHE